MADYEFFDKLRSALDFAASYIVTLEGYIEGLELSAVDIPIVGEAIAKGLFWVRDTLYHFREHLFAAVDGAERIAHSVAELWSLERIFNYAATAYRGLYELMMSPFNFIYWLLHETFPNLFEAILHGDNWGNYSRDVLANLLYTFLKFPRDTLMSLFNEWRLDLSQFAEFTAAKLKDLIKWNFPWLIQIFDGKVEYFWLLLVGWSYTAFTNYKELLMSSFAKILRYLIEGVFEE